MHTDIDYSKKLELDQLVLCDGHMMNVVNQYITNHHPRYLPYNRLSGQLSNCNIENIQKRIPAIQIFML
jgi:hypothetical protein